MEFKVKYKNLWCDGEEETQVSAKHLCGGSIPPRTSKSFCLEVRDPEVLRFCKTKSSYFWDKTAMQEFDSPPHLKELEGWPSGLWRKS